MYIIFTYYKSILSIFLPLGEPAIVTLGLFGHSGDGKQSYISNISVLQLELLVAVTGDIIFPFAFSIELIELAVVVDEGV